MARRSRPDRALVVAVWVSLAISVILTSRLVTAAAAAPVDSSSPAIHIVRSGDTLWGIAQRYSAAEADPRDFVDRMRRQNDLDTVQLLPGQRLQLPAPDRSAPVPPRRSLH